MPDVYISPPKKPIIDERTAFNTTAYFRVLGGDAGSSPAAADYRVDCLTTGTTLVDWTSLTPGETANVAIVSSVNRIIDNSNRFEKKQLTVASDRGTIVETRDVVTWKVRNIRGFSG